MTAAQKAALKILESTPKERIHTHEAPGPRRRGGITGRRVTFVNTRRGKVRRGAVHTRRSKAKR